MSSRQANLETKMEDAKDLIARLKRELDKSRRALAEQERRAETARQQLTSARRDLTSSRASEGALQAEVEEVRRALAELETRQARAKQALRSYRDLVGRFRAMIDAGTLRVKVVQGRMIVELATDILFAPGSAELSTEGKQSLAGVATVLGELDDRTFQVMGHTDDRPISTSAFPTNWHLGAARAIAVTQVLVDSGMSPEQISAASAAEFTPTAPNRTVEGRAANRRIEIVVIPDLTQLPGYDELQNIGNAP